MVDGRKPGRPRIYDDPKKRRREYMREYRRKQREAKALIREKQRQEAERLRKTGLWKGMGND